MKKYLLMIMISVTILISMESNVAPQTNTLDIIYSQPIEWCFYKGGIWYKNKDQAYARHILFDEYFMPTYEKSKIRRHEAEKEKLNKKLKFWKVISIILIGISSGLIIAK